MRYSPTILFYLHFWQFVIFRDKISVESNCCHYKIIIVILFTGKFICNLNRNMFQEIIMCFYYALFSLYSIFLCNCLFFTDPKHVWCFGYNKCWSFGTVCQRSAAARWKFLWWQMGRGGHTFLILCCRLPFVTGMVCRKLFKQNIINCIL